MEKVILTDGSGKFFNSEMADKYESKLAGIDDVVYNTEKGNWVMVIEDGDGDNDVVETTPEGAAQWFMENGYEFNDIPDDLQEFAGEEI